MCTRVHLEKSTLGSRPLRALTVGASSQQVRAAPGTGTQSSLTQQQQLLSPRTPHRGKHKDSAPFLPDNLGPLTKRSLNSFLSKAGVIAFAARQLQAGDYHCLYMRLYANCQYGGTCAFPLEGAHRRPLPRALTAAGCPGIALSQQLGKREARATSDLERKAARMLYDQTYC